MPAMPPPFWTYLMIDAFWASDHSGPGGPGGRVQKNDRVIASEVRVGEDPRVLVGVVAVVRGAAVVGAVLPVDRVAGCLERGLDDGASAVDAIRVAETGRAGVQQQTLGLRALRLCGRGREHCRQQRREGQTHTNRTTRRAGMPIEPR